MNLDYMDDIFSYQKASQKQQFEHKSETFDAVNEDDLYAIMGCHPSATNEQINAEYRVRARELHPDKCNDTDQQKCDIDSKFCKLQRAKDILCDEKRRRDYDRWRKSGLHLSYRKWCQLNESGGLHNSIHWMGSRDRKPALMCSTEPNSCISSNSTQTIADVNMNAEQTVTHERAGFSSESPFRQSIDKTSNLLKQFRNYEI